jgi:uncharacterized SAM-binding protein YcdF (DUF218 family)
VPNASDVRAGRPILIPPESREASDVAPTPLSRLHASIIGGLSGALAAFFLAALGLGEIAGYIPPPVLVLAGVVVGAAIGALRWHRLLVYADVALFVVYAILAFSPIAPTLAARWVRQDPVPASADAIVILSAAAKSDSALDAEGTQRLLAGLELFQRGVAPRVFTSRVETQFSSYVKTTAAEQQRILRIGGALPAWTALDDVENTHDEAVQSAAKLPEGARTIVVVTSPLHTPRACGTFEAVGFKVICYPAADQQFGSWEPVFARDRLATFRGYLYERLGMVKYRAKGWVAKR